MAASPSPRPYAIPLALLASSLLTLGVLAALPEAPAAAALFMQLGLATIAGGTGLGAGLSFWAQKRSGHTFPRSPVPRVLERLCPTCGCLAAATTAEEPTCDGCGAPRASSAWRRDTPQPLLAWLIALVASGACLFVVGALGSGREGFDAFTSHLLHGSSVAMAVGLTALAWFFFAHVVHASRRGTVRYVAGKSARAHDWRAVARVGADGTVVSAAGTSRVKSKKRFVPPLSLASSEEGRQVLGALRKLAAHDKLAVRVWREIRWERTEEATLVTNDYRSSTTRDRIAEETEEPYLFAADEGDSADEAWCRGIGLAAGGQSPLRAYLAWVDREPSAQARLIEAAAEIEAEEEAREEDTWRARSSARRRP